MNWIGNCSVVPANIFGQWNTHIDAKSEDNDDCSSPDLRPHIFDAGGSTNVKSPRIPYAITISLCFVMSSRAHCGQQRTVIQICRSIHDGIAQAHLVCETKPPVVVWPCKHMAICESIVRFRYTAGMSRRRTHLSNSQTRTCTTNQVFGSNLSSRRDPRLYIRTPEGITLDWRAIL